MCDIVVECITEREGNKMTIKKINTLTEVETNYGGGYDENDIKQITRGYIFNGLFYERKNSNYIYVVEAE